MITDLLQVAAAIYLAAGLSAWLGVALDAPRAGRAAAWLLVGGAVVHAGTFVAFHVEAEPPALTDLPAAVSWMSLFAVLFVLVLLRRSRLTALVALVAPAAFVGTFFAALRLPHSPAAPLVGTASSWPHLHVLLASTGLALLGVACVAGLLFLVIDRSLKHHKRMRRHWPSLEALDRVNRVALAVGFLLLTLGVATGMLWVESESGRPWTGSAAPDLVGAGLGDLRRAGGGALRRASARTRCGALGHRGLRLSLLRRDRREPPGMRVLLLGLNHRTASLDVRERFAVADPAPLLAKLVACDEIDEAVLISTCNRVEVIVLSRRAEAARPRLRSFFRRELGGDALISEDGRSLDDMLYELTDANAMQHVLRVACSIDSLVVGEPQILGQMKEAYRAAREADACGVILTRLFQCAFATAKRVRRETRIGERPVSVARVAVDLARQIFEDLSEKSALLIGAGEMIEIALEALRRDGLAAVRVANRTRARALGLAERFDASAHGLEEIAEILPRTDVVLTCIGGDLPVLTVPLVETALRARVSPLFVIDIGVPRNVDPAVNQLDGVYLYDLDDLSEAAAANAQERRRETVRAEAIVLEEQQRFDGWLAALQAVPTIRDLKARAESIRVTELDRAASRLALDDAQREGVEALTRAIVNKLLHAPVSRLRGQAEREDAIGYLEAARVLFGLDGEREAEAAGDDVDPDLESPEDR